MKTRSCSDRRPVLSILLLHFPFSILQWTVAGCAHTGSKPQWVYFPPPPDPPRVVHLVSFNSLHELIEPKENWVDMFRGARAESWVGRPMGIAWGADTLYICDTHADCVHAWNLRTGEARRLGGGGELKKPVAVAVDHTGTVYVADTVRGEVVALGPSTGEFGLFRPNDHDAYRPVAVAVSETELFVAGMAAAVAERPGQRRRLKKPN